MSGLLRSSIENPEGLEDYALERSLHSRPVTNESEQTTLTITSIPDEDASESREDSSAELIDIKVDKFPFNIGRKSESKLLAENDLHIKDSYPNTVSRGHCCIDQVEDRFLIRDRFSRLGTILNGEPLGRKGKNFAGDLNDGENELILGQENSPHKFLITLERQAD
ncbi:MAG: FHA domain-containing protein [Verrucomicrobiota bacterium]